MLSFKLPRGTTERVLGTFSGRLVAVGPIIGSFKASVGSNFVRCGYLPLLVTSLSPVSVLPLVLLILEVVAMPLTLALKISKALDFFNFSLFKSFFSSLSRLAGHSGKPGKDS